MNLHKRILLLLLTACCARGTARSQETTPAQTRLSTTFLASRELAHIAGVHALPPPTRSTQPSPGPPAVPQASPPDSSAPPLRWQQQVSYTIDVSLNDGEHTLDGFEKIFYHNNSPDTLSFIWIHLWPNAYKNDQTAFSNQLLDNGRTDFYFSDKGKKGYINRLDFRVAGIVAKMEDHPQYIDIIKIILPTPLLPGAQIEITTPFHVQLSFPFSGSGYQKGSYRIAQWYPQPAVYDQKGWHPIPYLDQGGSYNEYGDFDVRISLPKNYTVAATGSLTSLASTNVPATTQTLRFQQKNVPDFAWFANTNFKTDHDTLQLPSGRVIDLYAAYSPEAAPLWHPYGLNYLKQAIRFRSALIGEYPYEVASIVEITMAASGMTGTFGHSPGTAWPAMPRDGASYPTLAGIITPTTTKSFDLSIQQAIGLNWFHSILGPDERTTPWMAEGFNTYYDRRYNNLYYPSGSPEPKPLYISKNLPPTTPSPKTSPHNQPPKPSSQNHTLAHSKKSNTSASGNKALKHPSTDSSQTVPQTSSTNAQPITSGKQVSTKSARPAVRKAPPPLPDWIKKKLPADPALVLVNTLAKERKDQPISTTSENFTALNYTLMAHAKAAGWLQQLQDSLGTAVFDSCMRVYFRQWSFRHPAPEDLRTVFENTGDRGLSAAFARLDTKGPLPTANHPKKLRPTFLFSGHNTDQINYINIIPVVGYNTYDHLMPGILLHNFNLPPTAFQFLLAPLYATNSHQFTGAGYLGYTWYPKGSFQKVVLGLEGAKFSDLSGSDSNGNKLFGGFYKIAPSLRFTFKNKTARSTIQKWLEWKTYLIGEKTFSGYVQKSTDSLAYPAAVGPYHFRYLNQLSFNIEDNRVLYPYRALLQIQQGDRFYRINFTGNYFFNYEQGGGLDLRFFAAKFGYLGGTSSSLDLSIYQPKLTGVSGSEDYTYSNYFVGRNEYTGFSSQQIMIRDGGLKIRVPNFPFLEGRSDNWVSALNLSSTLPSAIVPRWLPLKVFLDIGTYAGGWQDNPVTSRFLYTGGLQLSLFHNIVNFYAPLVYSSDFSDQLKTIPNQNTFFKKLSFSIDLQNIHRKSPGQNYGGGNTPGFPL